MNGARTSLAAPLHIEATGCSMAPDAVQAEQVALHKATFEAQMHARCAQLDAGPGKVKFLSRLKRDRIGYVLHNWEAWTSGQRQAQVNQPGFSQAYHWNTTFRLVTIGGSDVVVYPFEPGTPLQQLQQPAGVQPRGRLRLHPHNTHGAQAH